MNKTYLILATIAIFLGLGLIILPSSREAIEKKELPPDRLLAELYDQTRFLSADEVAKKIMEGDPSYLFVDVRMPDAYKEYSLPGAINIPLNEILLEDWRDYLAQDARTLVFFSNGSIKAEQAWLLAQRLGYDNNNIMQGGLNRWVSDIIRPQMPPETASDEAFNQYRFRMAASMYFGGGSMDVQTEIEAEPVVIQRKKKKSVVEGGC